MHLPQYELKTGAQFELYEFVSEGPKGRITKLVKYSPIENNPLLYNLAFGDKNEDTGDIDDTVVSNNEDSEKVLATVVATIYAFTEKYPDHMVYATGSTLSRTRLYQRGITRYIEHVRQDFEIYGLRGKSFEAFRKGTNYDGFLVKRIKS